MPAAAPAAPTEAALEEQVRSRARFRRALSGTAAGVFARGTAVATNLVSIPIVLRYLGPVEFGIWATITSLSALFSFSDLGLGNGLVNALASTRAGEDRARAAQYVSSTAALLAALSVLPPIFFAIFVGTSDVLTVFGGSSVTSARSITLALGAFSGCLAVAMPLGIAQRVQLGLQYSAGSQLWSAAANLASFVALLGGVALSLRLPWLVLGYFGAPLIVQAANLVLLARRHDWARPRWALVHPATARLLLREGAMFFVLQICTALIFSSDNLIVSRLLGVESVTALAVPSRLFSLATVAIGLAVGPLWPAYGEARARGDFAWIRKALRYSSIAVVGTALAVSLPLVFAGPWLVRIWAGLQSPPSTSLLLWLAAFTVAFALSSALGTVMNGLGILKPQVICGIATATLTLLLKLTLGHNFGLEGIAAATTLGLLLFSVLPFLFILPAHLRRLHSETSNHP